MRDEGKAEPTGLSRREMIRASVAAVACGALPPVADRRALCEPLGLVVEDVEIVVTCEYSVAQQAWLIAATCYAPPILCTDSVTEKAIIEHSMSDAQLKACIKLKKALCYMVVKEELRQMAERQADSPFFSSHCFVDLPIVHSFTTPAPPKPSE